MQTFAQFIGTKFKSSHLLLLFEVEVENISFVRLDPPPRSGSALSLSPSLSLSLYLARSLSRSLSLSLPLSLPLSLALSLSLSLALSRYLAVSQFIGT